MDAITLEGFLTATAIRPVSASAKQWLLYDFCGNSEDPIPGTLAIKIFKGAVNLIMQFYKSVIKILDIGREKLIPTSYIREVGGKPVYGPEMVNA